MSTMFQSSEGCGNCIDSELGQCYNVENQSWIIMRIQTSHLNTFSTDPCPGFSSLY